MGCGHYRRPLPYEKTHEVQSLFRISIQKVPRISELIAVALPLICFLVVGYTPRGTPQPLGASNISGPRLLPAPVTPNDQTTTKPPTMTQGIPEVMASAGAHVNMPVSALKNAKIGYSLFYPDDWHVNGYVKWTEFAEGSQCESVEVVDFQPPPGSGAGFILHSFVQICAKPLTDSVTLDDFMRQTYGDSATQFQVTELAGMRAYRAINAERGTTWFLQTNQYRIQIATVVVSTPDKQDMRLSQVQQILASLSFQ